MKTVKFALALASLITGVGLSSVVAAPLGSAFSYQGHLTDSGAPAKGSFDLSFALFNADFAGTLCAPGLTNSNVAVSNGVFTALLDFGPDALPAVSCWLEIAVRPAGSSGVFTTLRPRQPLTPAPYAIRTLKAESLSGLLPLSQLPTNVARLDVSQTFTGTIQASGFIGNGSGLSNVAAVALSARLAQRLWRVSIPFITVTNAGNAPDGLTGIGAVPYNYRIGKYEINNLQYVVFLNAMATDDPNGLYSDSMTSTDTGGILRSGVPGDYHYTIKSGMEHRPVAWVDFRDAVRFCNWLHNGQPSGVQDATTTEGGAYTITAEGFVNNSPARNPGARFWIPNDDEWYKAAYHHPASAGGPPSGYWLFPTRSDFPVLSEPPPGASGSANVCCQSEHRATDVGAYVNSFSFYGGYDMAGNAHEWTETIVFVTNRRFRGGSWSYNEFYPQSTDLEFDTVDYEGDDGGFRVAGAVE